MPYASRDAHVPDPVDLLVGRGGGMERLDTKVFLVLPTGLAGPTVPPSARASSHPE